VLYILTSASVWNTIEVILGNTIRWRL